MKRLFSPSISVAWIWAWSLVLWPIGSGLAGQPTYRADPEYLIDTWEMEDGLPENSATAMAQTPDGYLWFGTFRGLVRFNGVKFAVFNAKNTPELRSDGIVNLHLERAGRLWVSTYNGMSVLENGKWRQVRPDDGWSGDYARTFSERRNGELLITTFTGKVIEFSNGHFTELPMPPGEQGQGYFGCVDEEDRWWVVQHRFIGRWESNRWEKMVSAPELSPGVVAGAGARDGGIWLLLGRELRKLRHGKESGRIHLPENPGAVWSISEDRAGNVWIASHERGFSRVAPDGRLRRWETANGGAERGRFVFEDGENNLWMGTSGNGLRRFKPRRFHTLEQDAVFKNAIVTSVWPDGAAGMWAGTYGNGLYHWNGSGITNVVLPGGAKIPTYIQSTLVDRSGRVWLGGFGNGLFLLQGQNLRSFPPEDTGGNSIQALFEDSRGRLWISGGAAISVYEGTNFQRFGPAEGLPLSPVGCFAEDSQGAIWAVNGSKAYRWVENGFDEVRGTKDQPLEGITCLRAEPDGSVWLGTGEGALFRWRQGKVDALQASYGFPLRNLRGIAADEQGFFWMTSDRSLARVNRDELHAAVERRSERLACQVFFAASDGLPTAEFSGHRQPAIARDAKGRLWFAMSKGVVMSEPARFRLNDKPPPVHIEEISFHHPSPKGGKLRANSPVRSEVESHLRAPFSGPVSLPPGSRRITLHYSGLSFTAPEKVRFQVKLEPEDTDWADAGTHRVAYYHELPPKDYVVRVRAANYDDVWNEAGASLAFSVRPFYWQMGWVQFLVVLGTTAAGTSVLWLLVRGRIRNIQERERAQDALRASEERYREVVESQIDLVCRFLPDTTLTFVNEACCRFFKQKREHLIGRKFLELLPETARSSALNHVRSLLSNLQSSVSEQDVLLPGSTMGWQHWTYHAIAGREGKVIEFQAMGRDITDRKLAEEARRHLVHATRVSTMGALAGPLAHELNQPLTAILSNAQAGSRFLANQTPNVAEVREVLQDIAQDTKRAGEVIRQMRKLVKKDEPQFAALELNQLIQNVARLLHSDTVIRKVQITLDCATALGSVHGEPVQLQQVLLNLLINAFDAMKNVPEGERTVLVRTRQPGPDTVQVEVSDCGPGIAADRLAGIFEPFQTTKPDGLGLGLSISRSIIEAHGGKLWAQNNPDRGATFCFTLPCS